MAPKGPMTYDSTQGNFLLFLHLAHDSTQWGLEPGPRSWCQDLRVGGRAEGIEQGPSGWSQGLGAGARTQGLEPGPGGRSQGPEARAWGIGGGGRRNEETKPKRRISTKMSAASSVTPHYLCKYRSNFKNYMSSEILRIFSFV